MSCDSAALPLRRFDSAGRPTHNLRAASVTVIPAGMTCCRMKRPTSVEDASDLAMEDDCIVLRYTLQFIA